MQLLYAGLYAGLALIFVVALTRPMLCCKELAPADPEACPEADPETSASKEVEGKADDDHSNAEKSYATAD